MREPVIERFPKAPGPAAQHRGVPEARQRPPGHRRLPFALDRGRTVQELMGHKTIQMTVRYGHLALKHQLAAVERLCDTGTAQQAPGDTKTDTDV